MIPIVTTSMKTLAKALPHSRAPLALSVQRIHNTTTSNSLRPTSKIPYPISTFCLEDLSVRSSDFFKEHRVVFNTLTADPYDARKAQLELLMKNFAPSTELSNHIYNYYVGIAGLEYLTPYINSLNSEVRDQFYSIASYRYRAVSSFALRWNGAWDIQRLPRKQEFTQPNASIQDPKSIDFRKFPRVFAELKEEHGNIPTFMDTLSGVANMIREFSPTVKALEMTAHHVRVYTRKNQITSNSPEGIHQDGYPFIVSALVVERHNITGGYSEVFLQDKATRVFRTQLQPGYGILQPDSGTDLWHHATPIYPEKGEGYRSSLGLDIAVIEEK